MFYVYTTLSPLLVLEDFQLITNHLLFIAKVYALESIHIENTYLAQQRMDRHDNHNH